VYAGWSFATLTVIRVSFSIALSSERSSGATNAVATPLAPARPVRPMRWT
jgi:hypothetical protein